MMASLFSGVSGLKNHQVKMNVIGNNIANINTIGYKGSRVNFQEALVQTFKGAGRPSAVSGGTNPIQLGLGMQVATIDNIFLQGGLETTGQITDLAIQGSGFFVLGDTNGNKFYSRAGAFGFDSNSNLVDPATGLFVMGKSANSAGLIPSQATVEPITLPFGQQDPARATEIITLSKNIDSSASTSQASIVQTGLSQVTAVSGQYTDDGVGGTHSISIIGSQAQAASYTGGINGLGLSTQLGALGVTDFSGFSISVDGGTPQPISALSASSTVEDVMTSISNIDGITATLTAGGEVQILRDKAGAPVDYNFTSSVSAANSVLERVFGVAAGSAFASGGGAASTFVATDTFNPDQGTGAASGPVVTTLDLVFDQNTGMVIGLDGLGGGGIAIEANGGLNFTTPGNELIIETTPTTHSTSLNVFDSQGGKHTATIEFFRSIVTNRWEWQATMLDDEVITGGGSGFVQFNTDGSLNTFEYNGGASALTIDPRNGASLMQIAIDAGTSGTFDGMTGFKSGTHTAALIGQDGYGVGILEKITVDQAGNISGIFTNGVNRVLAQIIMADFTNQAGLRKAGRSMFQPTANSGEPVEGMAGSTISASLTSGALESSSVDIAQEFTSMITAQRGFQANARIITTSDSMLDELVNIKR
ncbi:MAG: flagellar hook-basal body complex protein [bacterium]|nr:flagellar hook-basal body complex protein [bacterium]